MKKFLLLILILPFVICAQEDSLSLKNQTIDINNNKEVKIIDSILEGGNVLYVLNGAPVSYNEIKTLDFNKILSVNKLNADKLIICKNWDYILAIITEQPTEYDLAVLDVGYESFLSMQPSAGNFSLSYLQNKNQRYVSLWNQRVLTGNPEIYEMQIDYDSENYYGLEFEHKLYMFFKFMEKKHSISMM